MRESLQQTLKPIKEKTGLWWARFWRWPGLLCECHDELKQLNADLAAVRESLRSEQAHGETLERLSTESREIAAASMQRASAEKSLSNNLSEELGSAKAQLQKASETIGGLENRIARGELETERIKAELSKAQADLARSQFEQAREKDEHAQTRHLVRLLRQFIHTRDHVDIPAHPGTVKNILDGMKRLVVVFALLPLCLNAQFPPPILRGPYTTNTVAWAQTNVISLSTTNATSKPLTNHYRDGVLTLFGLQAGANITLSVNPSNIVITGSAGGGSGLTTNENQFLGVPLSIIDGARITNAALFGVTTNMDSSQQPFADFGTDLGTGARSYFNLFISALRIRDGAGGAPFISILAPVLGGSYSIALPDAQGANGQVMTNNGAGDLGWWTPGSPTGHNPNQFITNAAVVSVRAGALLTNTVHWESNALLPALIATNQPGGTIDLVTMLTTNGAGLRVTSNGAVVVHGVIGSTTNSFEVRRSNDVVVPLAVTHSNTVRIVGPSQAGYGATLTISSEEGSTQNNIELFAGSVLSGRWRSDNAGNQVISAEGGGELQLNYDGIASGRVAFGVPGVGNVWYMVPSASVAAWHGGTGRRGQVSNVWDVFVRSNVNWTEVGGSDRVFLQSTSGMSSYTMFLPITNGLAGQVLYNVGGGELSWKDDASGGGGLTTNANQFGASVELTIKNGAFLTNMNYWGFGTNHSDLWMDGSIVPIQDDTYILGETANAWFELTVKGEGVHFMEVGGGLDSVNIRAPSALAASYNMIWPDVQGGVGNVITNDGVGTLGWWVPGGPVGFNQNQFASNGNLVSIKSGALLTNTLFYPSNLTAPSIIATATTAQVTNLVELRSTNGTINVAISSNANAIVYGRLDMSNAVAFRTNNIDFRLPVYQAFTNALQTNLVLQLTNTYEGVTHRVDAYGAGRLGNGRTNAWQLFCTVATGTTIYWPPGTTNGNFDVLVNSNQIVSFTFMGGLGSTNILAAYRVLEGIGAN